jgi:hypothetical protein
LTSAFTGGAAALGAKIVEYGESSRAFRWRLIVYGWPVWVVLPTAAAILVRSPADASFPHQDFYRVTAEIIPLLLLALIAERALIGGLPRALRIEFVAVLVAAEAAAFVAVSGIFATGETDLLVGGGTFTTGILATVDAVGLLGGALLVLAAMTLKPPSGRVAQPSVEEPVLPRST